MKRSEIIKKKTCRKNSVLYLYFLQSTTRRGIHDERHSLYTCCYVIIDELIYRTCCKRQYKSVPRSGIVSVLHRRFRRILTVSILFAKTVGCHPVYLYKCCTNSWRTFRSRIQHVDHSLSRCAVVIWSRGRGHLRVHVGADHAVRRRAVEADDSRTPDRTGCVAAERE